MTRRFRRIATVAVLLLLLGSPWWVPESLRRMSWFAVERVEVSGAWLLAPHEVFAASGIRLGQNVWDDAAGWHQALLEHPGIASATVTRELPHTLRIRIEERRPVALLDRATLQPATAEGGLFPLDPARVPVDLPLVRASGAADATGQVTDESTRLLLAETGRLTELDPGLIARVSEVRRAPTGDLLLIVSQPAAELLIPPGIDAARLRQLRAVLESLARRASTEGSDSPSAAPPQIDLRFGDQIVVRYSSSA